MNRCKKYFSFVKLLWNVAEILILNIKGQWKYKNIFVEYTRNVSVIFWEKITLNYIKTELKN